MALGELTRGLVEEIARQYPALERLTLAQNALSELRYLELLPHLRRLDVSGNRLRQLPIDLATACPQLEFLDLTANALESLVPLRHCEHLEILRAGRNAIALVGDLCALQGLADLRELVLEGNPIAAMPSYRREVVTMLPQLTSLDGRSITPAERLYARLQDKPLVIPREIPLMSPTLPTANIGVEDATTNTEPPPPALAALDLSSVSSAGSVLDAMRSSSPSPRRPLLTPAIVQAPSTSLPPPLSPSPLRSVVRPQPSSQVARPSHDVGARNDPRPDKDNRLVAVSLPASVSAAPSKASAVLSRPAPVPATKDLESTELALLQSRISALESILSIQDGLIQEGLVKSGKSELAEKVNPIDVEGAARLYTRLLATWRDKVVSLMVQLKTADLTKQGTASVPNPRGDEMLEQMKRELASQVELMKQKAADLAAQRDLEQLRAKEARKDASSAEAKVVQVVRTLARERNRLQSVTDSVALFSSREGIISVEMGELEQAFSRLTVYERRLQCMIDRVQIAARLVRHREAHLRNSEAAIEAERRMWSHRLQDAGQIEMENSGGLKRRLGGVKRIRHRTEEALRRLFHRLDPYETGLVSKDAYVRAIRNDPGVLEAVGDETKRTRLVEHMETAFRERSPSHTLSGSTTWGEVILCFIPIREESVKNGDKTQLDEADIDYDFHVPPPFDAASEFKSTVQVAPGRLKRNEKKKWSVMTKDELISQLAVAHDDRFQLSLRINEDANNLRRRARAIEAEWMAKVDELVKKNDELQLTTKRQESRILQLQSQLDDAERRSSEAEHNLASIRRELCEREREFQRKKEELLAQRDDGIQREQEIWQRELQDASHAQSQLKAENTKLELTVRQLERELAKQKERLLVQESTKVSQLEDKLTRRDDEIARLRRERNSILTSLRDQERQLAARKQITTDDASTQTTTTPDGASEREVATNTVSTQTGRATPQVTTPQEFPPPEPVPRPAPSHSTVVRGAPIPPATTTITAESLQERLRRLERLSQSLLAE